MTTGVSARGLDIYDVGHVINYDLPKVTHGGIDEYIHRIGRTARIGHVGISTSFYSDEDAPIAHDIVKLLIETEQKIPDFLQDFKPQEGEELRFDEEDGGNRDGGTAEKSADEGAGGNGWAEEPKASEDAAWKPEEESATPADAAVKEEDAW